jgi:hypothetical protein
MLTKRLVNSVPAPGWKCFQFQLEEDQVNCFELPVIGWDVYERADGSGGDADYELAVWDAGSEVVSTPKLLGLDYPDSLCVILPPNEEMTKFRKEDAEEKLREQVERRASRTGAAK